MSFPHVIGCVFVGCNIYNDRKKNILESPEGYNIGMQFFPPRLEDSWTCVHSRSTAEESLRNTLQYFHKEVYLRIKSGNNIIKKNKLFKNNFIRPCNPRGYILASIPSYGSNCCQNKILMPRTFQGTYEV